VLLEREAQRPFELGKGPLFRATLYRLPSEHVLFFNVHHLVCDGWSVELMLGELLELYAAARERRAARLAELPMSFGDYAVWERARVDDARTEQELARAVARLEGAAPLELPTDHARGGVFSYRGRTLHFALPGELSRAIDALARRCETTRYVLLLAAYQLLLARYSGQSDIVVGSPVTGRDLSETEQLVGFFARTVVIRSELDLSQDFVSLLGQVKRACLAAFADQQVPFERLVERLVPTRDRSRTPLFQTLFSLQETSARLDPVSGLAWQALPVDNGGAKTDLTLLLEHDGSRIAGKLEYASCLFEHETIERMVANYQTLLESIVQEPAQRAARLELVHRRERAKLAELNETERELPQVGGFYELFRAQAERTPGRTAVIDGEGSLSYRELDQRSDAWAAELGARGVVRGARVGLALARTRRVLEVALGIMKAGAAYVPLDTSFPRERLAFMAEDAGLSLIVAESETRDALPGSCPLLLAEELTLDASAPLPRVHNEASDLAYIIYTSGSTGQPKGVEVEHGGVVNLLTSMAREPGCTEQDRVLAVSTFSFDMCIAELYLPLVVGACTILAPRTCAADGATLARYIDEYRATLVQATPTTFKLLVEAGLPRQRFKAIGGGEAFPGQLARALAPCCTEVWNGYGPTEITVYATFHRIDRPERPVLIGKPIANTRLYVLDGEQQPVPFGVAGELYIGGKGVSAGYRNQPKLTAERFLDDSFHGEPGARMYRTGDLVRMRPDGAQYVGRADQQVKLRGYRIELGEIESVLAQHASVEQCTVVVRALDEHDKRLVAYVVAKPGAVLSPGALRNQLEQQLPRYMVPRMFVQLEKLPLTASGKVNAKLLPDPRGRTLESHAPRARVHDATERVLTEIWQSVLGIAEIAPTDEFFALGGHSLLAVRLTHEINRAFHTTLSLSLVFESPTIRAQAERLNQGDHQGGLTAVPLARGGREPPLFCICGINLYQKLADELADERPVYGMFLPVEGELFHDASIELDAREMARQYLKALRSVQPHGPYHLAGISFGGVLAYEVAQQLVAQGEQVALLALLEVILPDARKVSRLRRLARRARSWLELAPGAVRGLRAAFARALTARGSEPALPSSELGDASELLEQRMQRYHGALAKYVADMPPYHGKVVLFRGRDQVRAMPGCPRDYGWLRHARGEFERFDIPGDHLGILREPNVRELARLLRQCLASSSSPG